MMHEFGINKNLNLKAYKSCGLNTKKNKIQLKLKQKEQIKKKLKLVCSGKFLKQKIKNEIDFIIKNKTFKGIRHKQKYPARGQRTHTNAKTKARISLY